MLYTDAFTRAYLHESSLIYNTKTIRTKGKRKDSLIRIIIYHTFKTKFQQNSMDYILEMEILRSSKLTSQPVASERLLILIMGVLPTAQTSPFLVFLFLERGKLFFLDVYLHSMYESTATDTEIAATTAPLVFRGAIVAVADARLKVHRKLL